MINRVALPTNLQTFAVKPSPVNGVDDLYVDDEGNIAIVFDLQAVLQACKQAALTRLGEMVLQTDQGIPYLEAVFVGVPNLLAFESALRTAWLATQGVVSVTNLTTKQNNSTITGTSITTIGISYTATILTVFGLGNIASENIFNG